MSGIRDADVCFICSFAQAGRKPKSVKESDPPRSEAPLCGLDRRLPLVRDPPCSAAGQLHLHFWCRFSPRDGARFWNRQLCHFRAVRAPSMDLVQRYHHSELQCNFRQRTFDHEDRNSSGDLTDLHHNFQFDSPSHWSRHIVERHDGFLQRAVVGIMDPSLYVHAAPPRAGIGLDRRRTSRFSPRYDPGTPDRPAALVLLHADPLHDGTGPTKP